MTTVTIRPATAADTEAWLALRCALWPDGTAAEHRAEIEQYLAGAFPRGPWVALLAEDGDGRVVGLAEVSTRPCAEGCETTPVAYLEGWIVAEAVRRAGVGRALVDAAAAWGRERGCREFASDSEPENHVSAAAHQALGFEDAGLVRCFRMAL